MIIVKLFGGLGNQMFQYAAARRLAIVNDATLKLDLEWFANIPKGDTSRHYELGVFNTMQNIASSSEVKALRGFDTRHWPKLAKRLLAFTGMLEQQSFVRERDFHFDPNILNLNRDVYLDGYWQSPLYFADVEKDIRREFTVSSAPDKMNSCMLEKISNCTSVAVHIRRGDYLSNAKTGSFHGLCSLEYYNRGITEIAARVCDLRLFVFSDDPAWVQEHFRPDIPMICVDNNGPDRGYEDLRLMAACRHHIIANSSFSWWGAWLNDYSDKIVVAPQKWFNSPDIDTCDLIPDSWLRV